MNDEACPRDLPEQGVQPMVTVAVSSQGQPSGPIRVDDQHPTDPQDQ